MAFWENILFTIVIVEIDPIAQGGGKQIMGWSRPSHACEQYPWWTLRSFGWTGLVLAWALVEGSSGMKIHLCGLRPAAVFYQHSNGLYISYTSPESRPLALHIFSGTLSAQPSKVVLRMEPCAPLSWFNLIIYFTEASSDCQSRYEPIHELFKSPTSGMSPGRVKGANIGPRNMGVGSEAVKWADIRVYIFSDPCIHFEKCAAFKSYALVQELCEPAITA
jgi:hypothetical protein